MQKWEYINVTWTGTKIWVGDNMVADNKNAHPHDYFKQLGEQGWEMVTAVSESVSTGGFLTEKWGGIRWYFKRPKD